MKQKNIFSTACHTLTAVRASLTAIVMLLTAAVDIARADEWPAYISDVKLIGGTEATTNSLKNTYGKLGWKVIDYNLNLNCKSGSDYIYLLYKTTSGNNIDGGYITDFYISDHSGASSLPETVTFNNKEYTLCPYTGDDHFESIKGDLNSYAGGSDIHLYYTKANFTDKRVVAAITFDASSANAIPWNGNGTTAADLNKGCGISSAYIYMHLTTATKTNRPKTDPVMKSGLVYNGQAQQLIMTAATIESGEMCYLVGTSGTFTTNVSSITAKDAGRHTVSYYASENQYGDASATHSQAVSIGKSPNNGLAVTIASIIDKGATPSPTLIGTNLSTGTATFLYATSASGSYSATVPTAPGSYWVKATIAADNNCDAFTTQAVNFRIMPWQGSGTAASPYLIKTTDDLRQLATDANGGNKYDGTYFRLENDLDFQPTSAWDDLTNDENNFTAIGNFYGHFNGGSHTISGIRIYKGNTITQGLFSVIGEGGEVSNLTLTNTRIVGGSESGGIVGHNWSGTISNCHVTATVDIHAMNSTNNSCSMHGGIVGENSTKDKSNIVGTVSGCTSAAQLTTAEGITCSDFGGIAGFNYYGKLTGNVAIGVIVAECVDSRHGAIVGRNSYATLTNNYYRNCNVEGCNGSDTNGAMPLCSLTLGDGISATTTSTTFTVTSGSTTVSYYYPGTVFTLSGGLDALANPAPGYRKGYVTTAGTVSYNAANGTYTLTLQGDATVSTTNRFPIDWADEATGSDADNAYMIYNAEQLDLVAQRVNNSSTWAVFGSKYYRLMSDIDYVGQENSYTAIGTSSYPFSGHFDGGSHAVSYININQPDKDYQGLFGYIGQGGEVKNFVVNDARIIGKDYMGCIAGYNNGGTLANNYYFNCVSGKDESSLHSSTGIGIGCNGADITDSDGALPVFGITVGHTNIAVDASHTAVINERSYYKAGTTITLGGQPDGTTINKYYDYTLNGTALSGNTFNMPVGDATISFSSTPTTLTAVAVASGITATPSPLKSDGTHNYYMPGTTITLSGGTPATPAPDGYFYPYTVNGVIISGNTFEVPSIEEGVGVGVIVGASSEPILDTPNRFITAGDWNEDANWQDGTVPAAGSNVIICAPVTVPASYVADAGEVMVMNNATITVEDGGELMLASSGVTVSMEKTITKGGGDSGYHSIASPVTGSINASDVANMTEGEGYRLCSFNLYPDAYDWIFHEDGTFSIQDLWPAATTLENGKGYAYANQNDVTLTFTGTVRPTSSPVTVPLENLNINGKEYEGWNLVGNPFPCSAYIVCDGPVYRMDGEGKSFVETESHVLAPMEAVLLKAAEGEQEVTFFPDLDTARPLLVLKDNQDNSEAIEAAAKKNKQYDVLMQGRTLYKDGRINVLCLPFDIESIDGTPLEGAEIYEINSSNIYTDNSRFVLAFQKVDQLNNTGEVDKYLKAGIPSLVRWSPTEKDENPNDLEIVNPFFRNVVINSLQPNTVITGSDGCDVFENDNVGGKEEPGTVSFVGTFSPVTFTTDDYDAVFVDEGTTIGACRGYFKFNGLRQLTEQYGRAFAGLNNSHGELANDIASLFSEAYFYEEVQVDSLYVFSANDIGVILYSSYVPMGDVNGDDNVTPADAIMILYRYFGVKQNGFLWRVADLNGDSHITPADAIETLYRYFGDGSSNSRTTRTATGNSSDPE
ncbi:MAG: hypothetical protein K6D37_13290 [Prevotella sp.]|nr:hypothetical protein [Prevotella sp.]